MKKLILVSLLAGALVPSAQAQEFPSKSIRVIVSFAPGGVVDTSTRIVTSKITEALNWHFVVDNRPGRMALSAQLQQQRPTPMATRCCRHTPGSLR